MRPVDLIPPEHRRRERGPARTGVAPWAIVGALVFALAAITAVTMFGNQISEREAERVIASTGRGRADRTGPGRRPLTRASPRWRWRARRR